MPTSLLTISSILYEIGVETTIYDENITNVNYDHNIVGINLLGAPYISVAMQIEKMLIDKFEKNFSLLLGGQVISGLTDTDFKSLFSDRTFNGNSSKTISNIFNIDELKIPKIENVSLVKTYEKIGDESLRLYLQSEFSFYLSQGCKFSCSFCAANRALIGQKGVVQEVYRDIDIALKDFEYLIEKAVYLNIKSLNIYFSNLDLFQTPSKLHQFAEGIVRIRKKHISIDVKFRGLSTSSSFLAAHKYYPQVIHKMIDAGLTQIGFGIDGATAKVYKKTRKPQTVKLNLEVIKICREKYNITPEILMVFGHNDLEDEEALSLALSFCEYMMSTYQAIPRPHVAKDIVPGNDGWMNIKNNEIIREFYKNPILFQNLDFTAVPSPITHPDSEFREMVAKYYKKVCELPGSLTQYVLPELPSMSKEELHQVRLHNKKKYDI